MRSIWLSVLLLLASCGNLESVKEQSLKAVKESKPDEAIVSKMKLYEGLYDVIATNFNLLKGSGDVSPSKVIKSCMIYSLESKLLDSVSPKRKAAFQKMKKSWQLLGNLAPKRVEICSDGEISFTVIIEEDFENYDDFYLQHVLIWNVSDSRSNKYLNQAHKDIEIGRDVIYRIGAVYTG